MCVCVCMCVCVRVFVCVCISERESERWIRGKRERESVCPCASNDCSVSKITITTSFLTLLLPTPATDETCDVAVSGLSGHRGSRAGQHERTAP